jgi:cytochrome bd-type quinol oxidase subunit 2
MGDRLTTMNVATCAVLTGVFPLILIAIVADRRGIHLALRRRRWYRQSVVTTIGACLIGIAYSVIGVQNEGFSEPVGAVLWVLFSFALLAFAMSVMLTVATQENEEDDIVGGTTSPEPVMSR